MSIKTKFIEFLSIRKKGNLASTGISAFIFLAVVYAGYQMTSSFDWGEDAVLTAVMGIFIPIVALIGLAKLSHSS
jgi:hypothetical protein